MTEDQMNPNICPGALDADGNLDSTLAPGAHKWFEATDERTGAKVGECSECGAHMDIEDAKRTIGAVIDQACDMAETKEERETIRVSAHVLEL